MYNQINLMVYSPGLLSVHSYNPNLTKSFK